MVARNQQAARLKLAVAAGGGTLLIFLAVIGGVVGWFSVSSPEELQHPEVTIIDQSVSQELYSSSLLKCPSFF